MAKIYNIQRINLVDTPSTLLLDYTKDFEKYIISGTLETPHNDYTLNCTTINNDHKPYLDGLTFVIEWQARFGQEIDSDLFIPSTNKKVILFGYEIPYSILSFNSLFIFTYNKLTNSFDKTILSNPLIV
jgi:hypothetical protein